MQNKIARSIIITPVPPKEPIRDVGYLQINTVNKELTIYDELGQKSSITSTEKIQQKIQALSTALSGKMDKPKVYNGTALNNIYTASYLKGDIHTLSVNNATNLFVTDIPIGYGLMIRIVVNDDVNITFKENTNIIISEAGTYYLAFANVIGITEMTGQAIKIS